MLYTKVIEANLELPISHVTSWQDNQLVLRRVALESSSYGCTWHTHHCQTCGTWHQSGNCQAYGKCGKDLARPQVSFGVLFKTCSPFQEVLFWSRLMRGEPPNWVHLEKQSLLGSSRSSSNSVCVCVCVCVRVRPANPRLLPAWEPQTHNDTRIHDVIYLFYCEKRIQRPQFSQSRSIWHCVMLSVAGSMCHGIICARREFGTLDTHQIFKDQYLANYEIIEMSWLHQIGAGRHSVDTSIQIQDGRRPPSCKNRKIVISQPRFARFWRHLASKCSSTLLTVPTVKNLKFRKSKMAAAAILKNWKIAISQPRFNRFWRNLAQWCISNVLTVPTVKNLKFCKSKMVAAAILKI